MPSYKTKVNYVFEHIINFNNCIDGDLKTCQKNTSYLGLFTSGTPESHSNDKVNDFNTNLEASVDRHAPLKKLTAREIKIKNKPWLSTEILKMIKIRNKIFTRKKRQPNNENCLKII